MAEFQWRAERKWKGGEEVGGGVEWEGKEERRREAGGTEEGSGRMGEHHRVTSALVEGVNKEDERVKDDSTKQTCRETYRQESERD